MFSCGWVPIASVPHNNGSSLQMERTPELSLLSLSLPSGVSRGRHSFIPCCRFFPAHQPRAFEACHGRFFFLGDPSRERERTGEALLPLLLVVPVPSFIYHRCIVLPCKWFLDWTFFGHDCFFYCKTLKSCYLQKGLLWRFLCNGITVPCCVHSSECGMHELRAVMW